MYVQIYIYKIIKALKDNQDTEELLEEKGTCRYLKVVFPDDICWSTRGSLETKLFWWPPNAKDEKRILKAQRWELCTSHFGFGVGPAEQSPRSQISFKPFLTLTKPQLYLSEYPQKSQALKLDESWIGLLAFPDAWPKQINLL